MKIRRTVLVLALAVGLTICSASYAGFVTICEYLPIGKDTCVELTQPADSGKDAAELVKKYSGKEVSLGGQYVLGAGFQYLQTKITGKKFSRECQEAATALLKEFAGEAPDVSVVADLMATGLMSSMSVWAVFKRQNCDLAKADYWSAMRDGSADPVTLKTEQDGVFTSCTTVPELAKSTALIDAVNKHINEKYAGCAPE